jgi:hypothetical protein
MFLSDDELTSLTGAKRRDARVRALRAMGIEHRVRPDGTVIVLRSHVEQLLGGAPSNRVTPEREPNWDALRRPEKSPNTAAYRKRSSSGLRRARLAARWKPQRDL